MNTTTNIDQPLVDELKPSGDQERHLRNIALGLLARREHSRKELHQKLARKSSPEDTASHTINSVLDSLTEQGLLSDDRFTEAYVNMRARKGYGPTRIAMELADKGIDADLAQHYLTAREDWQELLVQAWRKKYRSPPSEYKEKARQMRFLQSRGFSVEAIKGLFENYASGS